MSGAQNPIDFPQAWDNIYVDGVPSPGLCEVGEFKRAYEWDIKKGKGAYGSNITFLTRPPAKGVVTFTLWTQAHFTAWDTFRAALKYDPTKKTPNSVELYHPSLADIDVSTVVCENIGNIVHRGGGLYVCQVAFLEYFPPPKQSAVSAAGAPVTSPSNPGSGTPVPTALTKLQQENAALLAQAQQP